MLLTARKMPSPHRFFARSWVIAGAAMVALACGGPDANSPGRPLPPFEGHATELFDDSIEPAAVGLSLDDAADPKADAKLRERTQTSDAVVKVRIETVTGSGDEGNMRYQIGLRVLDVLTGSHPPGDTFMVTVDKSSDSIGIVKSLDSRLGGKTFIAFVREFQQGDDRRFHFHMSADAKDVAAAVKAAVDLADLQK